MEKKENTFLMVSLEEDKARKLGNIITNEVSRKILDLLANKDATESQISKELGVAISTVHYNLKQLVDAGLVKSEEYHYSEKGKEVNHYTLANKYIIIAPKSNESLMKKLKGILPVFIIVAATGYIVQLFTKSSPMQALNTYSAVAGDDVARSAPMVADQATKVAAESATAMIAEATNVSDEVAAEIAEETVATTVNVVQSEPNIALWFIIGALFSLVLYLIYDILRERFK